jgi:hypothetical protein
MIGLPFFSFLMAAALAAAVALASTAARHQEGTIVEFPRNKGSNYFFRGTAGIRNHGHACRNQDPF